MSLPRSNPLAEQVDPAGILAMLDAVESSGLELHSLMIARHGKVIAEGWWAPYGPERPHLGYSLSKSFTATIVGMLIDEGRLGLDDRVVDFFPWAQGVSPRYRDVRVRHCLAMTTGHLDDIWVPLIGPDDDAAPDPYVAAILHQPPRAEPGSVFVYNQRATYLLSAIVRTVTGTGLLDQVRTRLLEPWGMPDALWHTTTHGNELGFSGIHVTTETILHLAQLYADGGAPLLSPGWVGEATRPTGAPRQDPPGGPDWDQGYGFSFWGCRHGYRGDGAFGQYAIVLPEHDVTVAITSEVDDMQSVLDAIWEHLLPAVGRDGDPDAEAQLTERLAALHISPLRSLGDRAQRTWSVASAWGLRGLDGTLEVTPDTEDSARIRLTLSWGASDVPLEFVAGDGTWTETTLSHDGWLLPIVASGGFRGEDAFELDVRPIETPHRILLRANGDHADIRWNLEPLMGPWPFSLAVRRSTT